MQKLTDRQGFPAVDRALRFVLLRLGSRPETASLQADVKATRDTLRAQHEAWQQAKDERVAASAEIEYVDGLVDREVMSTSREALVLTGGDRDDSRYRTLFPVPPSQAMRPVGGDEQRRYVGSLTQQIEADEAYASLRPRAEQLRTLQARLDALEADRQARYLAEEQARTRRAIALDDARRVHNRLYFQLRLLLDDEALVESFFL